MKHALIILLSWVLVSAFSYALRVPAEILTRMHHSPTSMMVLVIRNLGTFLSQTLATPIGTIALTLVYYDQRIRKEAFDLEVMMQGIKQADAQPAATSASL